MYRNYLKVALRNLTRHIGFSIINIAGLTLGITGCLLVTLFVLDEMKFDKFHKDSDRIYRLYTEGTGPQGTSKIAVTPPMFATTLKAEFPEVESATRIMYTNEEVLLRTDKNKHYEGKGFIVEPGFFDMFTLPLKEGTVASALDEPTDFVITEEIATKYFGTEPALGKTIYVGSDTFQVSAVMKSLPEHFHLDINYLYPLSYIVNTFQDRMQSWGWQQFFSYVKLKEGADATLLEKKFTDLIVKRVHPITSKTQFTYIPFLQAVTKVHLHSAGLRFNIIKAGNIVYIRALTVIAIFVLLIACFNFINLSTARSMRRAREVGMRKVLGAEKKQLWIQFTGESIMLSVVAAILASVFTILLLPALNQFTEKNISFNPVTSPVTGFMILALGVVTGILAGIYPALFMSSFKPISILKGMKTGASANPGMLRKSLVVLQFALSVFLIVSTTIVFRQVDYMKNTDLGFVKDQVIFFPMRGDNMTTNYETFKNELQNTPGVASATIGYGLPGDVFAGDNIIVPEPTGSKTYPANQFLVDHDYIKTLGLQIIAGRDFSKEMKTDADAAFIINETAVRTLGFESPDKALGKELHWPMWLPQDTTKVGKVIGVVKDFHISNFRENVNPLVLQIFPGANWKVAVKLSGNNLSNTIAGIEKVWNKFSPESPLAYQFLDENFELMYKAEEKLTDLLVIFTAVAIFIACLGLFGLATNAAEQRIKEIGIRKVLGASINNIVGLLSKDFMKLVFISLVIGFPVAWMIMTDWLENFAYRRSISGWIFAGSAIMAVLIAFVTISFQAIRAAVSNPVKSLRTE